MDDLDSITDMDDLDSIPDMDDFEEEISRMKSVVFSQPEDSPRRSEGLELLGNAMRSLYFHTENTNDLDEAILYTKQAVTTRPDNDPSQAKVLHSLGGLLGIRYRQTGDMTDLETAIQNMEQAVSMLPEDDPSHTLGLEILADLSSSRHSHTGEMNDLEAAIRNSEQAISASPQDPPTLAPRLMRLHKLLFTRYECQRTLNDLDTAIHLAEQAVSITSELDDDFATNSGNLGGKLHARYERTGNRDDLNAAIYNTERGISSQSQDHPYFAPMSNGLAVMLLTRFEDLGNVDDLEAAMANSRKAIDAAPKDSVDLSQALSTLGGILSAQYYRTGNTDHLEAAISNIKKALSITPNNAKLLCNLGGMLSDQYTRTGKHMSDLETAISHIEEAIQLTDEKNPDIRLYLNNLGLMFSKRYKQTRNMDDLETAISKIKKAMSLRRDDDTQQFTSLINLGDMLFARYKKGKKAEDLEEAISITQKVISATPKDNHDVAQWQRSLGHMLLSRPVQTQKDIDENVQAALTNFEEGSQCLNASPLSRVLSARRTVMTLQFLKKWERACQVAEEAVKLLPLVCRRYLNLKDQQHAIQYTSGLAAMACSLSLKMGNVSQALQQIEFGRGLILGYLIDNQSDISVLRRDPSTTDLADKFEEMRLKVSRSGLDATKTRQRTVEERAAAVHSLEACLDQIRQVPGHEQFLLEPELDGLLKGAADGPVVVVNITDISSDAIIVSQSGLRSITLPKMTSEEAQLLSEDFQRYRSIDDDDDDDDDDEDDDEDQNRDIQSENSSPKEYSAEFLSMLWTDCVKPILKELSVDNSVSTEILRIWWIGTGIASSFPFHAAGDYRQNTTENTLSQTISSYTPTIKALRHARSCAETSIDNKEEKDSVLIVAMPETPGKTSLPGVRREASAIEQVIGDVFKVKRLEQPSVPKVIGEMGQSDIVHFACHGSSDRSDPSNSHLLLQKNEPSGKSVEKLTLQQISESQSSRRAQLAYLSACSTAEVKAGLFADEALHLVSAFQVAGFRHVIGSLWPVDDETSAEVAQLFYQNLLGGGSGHVTNRSVAEALRSALLQIRVGRDPRVWASYIHSGA